MQVGRFYVVATPIGHLGDLSMRALAVLKQVQAVLAEDTRHTSILLKHFDLNKPCFSLHRYNEQAQVNAIIHRLQGGEDLALVSDAGTPTISDPGYRLIAELHRFKIPVIPIPGACALITALSASGLPADQFLFLGFLPTQKQAKANVFEALQSERKTAVAYEAPHRIINTLTQMQDCLGHERILFVAKELTKRYETLFRGSIGDCLNQLRHGQTQSPRGEFVLVLQGQALVSEQPSLPLEIQALIADLKPHLSAKTILKLVSKTLKYDRNLVYQAILNENIGKKFEMSYTSNIRFQPINEEQKKDLELQQIAESLENQRLQVEGV